MLTQHNKIEFSIWLLVYRSNRTIYRPFFSRRLGKISAAASTEYAIDDLNPRLGHNIGTCGGFKGQICTGEILLVEETVVYDILEQMGDPQEALRTTPHSLI